VKVVVSDVNEWKKKLDVTVPSGEVENKTKDKIKEYQKKAKLDGFRQGKVPVSLIEKRFGEALKADAVDDCIDKFFKKAILENKIDIVAPGKITDVKYDDGRDLEFSAEVEVTPEVDVNEYTGFKVEKDIVPVTDEDVDNTIMQLREEAASINETDDAAQEGFIIRGTVQEVDESGMPIVGKKWDDQVFELGKPPIINDSLDQLKGVKKGDERRFSLLVPKQDGEQQKVEFSITVDAVFEKKLPEPDDEFVKKFGPFGNIDALKAHIRDTFTKENESRSESALETRIIDEVIKHNDFELPPSLVEAGLDNLWEDYKQKEKTDISEDDFRKSNKPVVEWNLKWDILYEKIAEKEAIEITDEDMEEHAKKIEETSEEEAKKFRRYIKNSSNRKRVVRELLVNKVIDFLKSKSKIKEVKQKKQK